MVPRRNRNRMERRDGETLGHLVKRARMAKRWSQKDLAQATGISRGYLGKLETDRVQRPGTAILIALERNLDLSREDLLRASHILGPVQNINVLEELRAARLLPLEERMAVLTRMPPEVFELIRSYGVDMLLSGSQSTAPAAPAPGPQTDTPPPDQPPS